MTQAPLLSVVLCVASEHRLGAAGDLVQQLQSNVASEIVSLLCATQIVQSDCESIV